MQPPPSGDASQVLRLMSAEILVF